MSGPVGFILAAAYIALSSWLVTTAPRSLLFRLLFLSAILVIYYIPQRNWVKVLLGAIVVLILLPLLGLRNPFLLELGFQVAAFASLALGLNIVVGFAGLPDLG